MIRLLILLLAASLLQISCASTMLPDSGNSAPIAVAGQDRMVAAGELVELDGGQSSDVDGNELIFRWRLIVPDGSQANLSSTNFVKTSFTPDVEGSYSAELIVSDGSLDSTPSIVKIEVSGSANSRPIAMIVPVSQGAVGIPLLLDGSQSEDADGDVLTFDWLIEGGPEDSTAQLSDVISPTPTFTPDVVGEYEISLIVSDGLARSEPVSVFIDVSLGNNLPPVADPGADREVAPNTTVMLDGSRSTDPENGQLVFAWSILERPTGSSATLTDPTIINPSFVADEIGVYRVQLVVGDGVNDSAPATLQIEAKEGNLAPLADAGPDQNAVPGTMISLDGTGSSDPNGDTIQSYAWSFVSRPGGSNASLSNSSAARPTFTADVAGTYEVQLIVNDGTVDSAPDTIRVICAINNQPPVADAGNDQNGNAGVLVTLDGRGSSDPNNDTLSYDWTMTTRPGGSSATLNNDTTAMPTFIPDLTGTYIVSLTVNDGLVDSNPDTVTITVGQSIPSVEGDLILTEVMINPMTLADADGEFIELYNPTANAWQLQGCVLSDLGTDTHSISQSIVVASQTYVVLAISNMVTNYDYVYSNFQLANGGDEVILTCSGNEISNLAYDAAFDVNGMSNQLLTSRYDEIQNDSQANWCPAATAMPGGDFGTPGTVNEFNAACP